MHHLRTLTHHPFYRRELTRLAIIRPAHIALIIASVLGLTTLLCGLPLITAPPPWVVPHYAWSMVVFASVVVLLVGEEVLLVIISFAAAILSGLITSGLESRETDELLHLANVPPDDVLRVRTAAVLRTLRIPIIFTILVRVLLVLMMLAALPNFTSWLFDTTAAFPPNLPALPPALIELRSFAYHVYTVWTQRLDSIRVGWGWPPWALMYVAQPVLDALVFALVAGALAARARSRSAGLIIATGAFAALWIAGYAAERLIVFTVSLIRVNVLGEAFPIDGWRHQLIGSGLPLMDRVPYLWSGSLPMPVYPITLLLLVLLTLAAKLGVMWWALKQTGADAPPRTSAPELNLD
jgi:hypothetical protein